MKKIFILCAFIAGLLRSEAQTVIDSFTVGPYMVDYLGQGDYKYRLRDNIDLYKYFDLKKDTVIVAPFVETSVRHALQISAYAGANRYASKEAGLSAVWKQGIGENLYFNGGLSFAIGHSDFSYVKKCDMIEVGVPLQIEVGKLSHQKAGLYGVLGITPTAYSTMSVKKWTGGKSVDVKKDYKESGFLAVPSLEFGGNIPVGNAIVRIGVYGKYKINCTSAKDAIDIYEDVAGHCFFGAKIGVAL